MVATYSQRLSVLMPALAAAERAIVPPVGLPSAVAFDEPPDTYDVLPAFRNTERSTDYERLRTHDGPASAVWHTVDVNLLFVPEPQRYSTRDRREWVQTVVNALERDHPTLDGAALNVRVQNVNYDSVRVAGQSYVAATFRLMILATRN